MSTSRYTFQQAEDGINPATVPQCTLYTGAKIPAIGLGTFGSDSISHETVAQTVVNAAGIGYRHFDCASVYSNEAHVGEALTAIQQSGVAREDLWITSKVWNDMHAPDDVRRSCEQSLKDLQLDYLDCYLVHWPFRNFHPPGCDVESRSADATPYFHENYMKTWRAMEALVQDGLVKHIGTSNMTLPKMELLLRDAEIKPAVNEMELHPHFQQPELFDHVVSAGIQPIGFCPLGSPGRPERDRTPEDTDPLQDEVLLGIAKRLSVHPAVICLKWAIQRGQVPIPFSVTRRNYTSNLQAAVSAPLSEEDMKALADIDQNCRLIKGQVFLWEGQDDWQALWDIDGTITTR